VRVAFRQPRGQAGQRGFGFQLFPQARGLQCLAGTAQIEGLGQVIPTSLYIVANGNEGVQNIYGRGGVRALQVVEEAQLDGNSTSAWYLAADPSQIDTVEVSFLQGEESPVLDG
jgi:hypothetical protein